MSFSILLLLSFYSKYSTQHPILEHPQAMFFLHSMNPRFTSKHIYIHFFRKTERGNLYDITANTSS